MDRDERAAWGPLIKQARLNLGLEQRDLAEQANTSRQTIGNIERGATVPQADVLDRILRVLGLRQPELDGDVRSFLALMGPLLQQLSHEQRADVMPDLVVLVTQRLKRGA